MQFYKVFYLLVFCAFGLQSQSQEMRTIEAQENIYLVGDRTFSLFYVTDSSVVVIDPINISHAETTLKAIREITDKPISHLFYSHNHWDHISGGKVFKDEGATIISHIRAKENIPENDDVLIPDETWGGPSKTYLIGNKELQLHYFGRNHGAGMTVFRFPEHNAVFIIDLVVPDRVLYAYLPDADPSQWRKSLEKIQSLEFDQVLMSHVRAIGNRDDLQLMQDYFRDLYEAVETELENDTPFFEIPKKVKLPQYAHLKNYEEWLEMNVWRILMEKSIGQ
ncbi:MBL fold metallo-hydrolase [Gramella sp. GC03-9]|uniref:MBL fold metallo-hydrolase n=1 Tax=Christiangramia oceanisediminis TaxID=2920386 RepID=A0A9X2KXF8_9FLAO|nr:MBL fold metallo-hydrolase [Gramella oceanisediminis]MCP9199651.1 MBL fold metallo-hydrolase [Gramella oceanisediminis]